MKVQTLQVSNIKKLRSVTITPDGSVVTISGRNGQGKTSILDSIAMAIGGKDLCPVHPIRRGEETAKIKLTLDNGIVVTRTFKKTDDGFSSALEIKSADGLKYPKPQKFLDDLVGRLSFDPLGFMRLKPKDQAEALRVLAKIDLEVFSRKRANAFERRTLANRDMKALQARLDAMPEVEAPDGLVSVASLLADQRARMDGKAANDEARETLASYDRDVSRANRQVEERQAEIFDLKAKLKEAELFLDRERRALRDEKDARDDYAKSIADIEDPDLDEIPGKIASAEKINEKVRAKIARAEVAKSLESAAIDASYWDAAIVEVDGEKEDALLNADLPVPGLGIDVEDGVTLNGIPIDQASAAEQLKVSVAMGLALNPTLKVILIRDGSLLDEDSIDVIAKMAEEADAQAWVERVGHSDGGILIEDGEVVRQ